MSTYFNENLIPEHTGTNFVVEKKERCVSDFSEEKYTISQFKYIADVMHTKFNAEQPAKNFVGDMCETCGWDVTKEQYNDVLWNDVLYLGLYLGVTPDYIAKHKSPQSIDVVEEDQEVIDYVSWIDDDINVIQHDEWNYATSKKYDVIICDLWAMPDDITDVHRTSLLNNYFNNLKSGGKIIIPISGETLN